MKADSLRPRLLALVVDDPWRKLLAVGLAVLLWFFIDNQITRTIRPSVPLVAVDAQGDLGRSVDRLAIALPLDRVVLVRFSDGQETIDHVSVVLTGPRYRIAAFEDNDEKRLDLQITKFLALDWSDRTSVEFTAADISRDQRGFEDVVIQLDPPRIRVEVERIADLPVPLSLDVVDLKEEQLAGRLVLQTATFAPETAVVLGPAIGINELRKAEKKFRATMKSAGNDKQVTVELELIRADLGLKFATPPQLTIQVLPRTATFSVEVPVVVDDLALPPKERGAYLPPEKTRTVRIRAGGDLRMKLAQFDETGDKQKRAEWVQEYLRLVVHISKPESGAQYQPEIEREARLRVVGRMSESVDRNEYSLDEVVLIKLRRTQ